MLRLFLLLLISMNVYSGEFQCNIDKPVEIRALKPTDDFQFSYAVAGFADGKYYIYYDEARFKGITKEVQLAIIQHECGHHALNHVPNQFSPEHRNEAEKAAECFMAKQLKETYKPSDWFNLNKFLTDNNLGFTTYGPVAFGEHSKYNVYSRINTITQCRFH